VDSGLAGAEELYRVYRQHALDAPRADYRCEQDMYVTESGYTAYDSAVSGFLQIVGLLDDGFVPDTA
jgi:hypothetical protein